jgi:hypothetical protein
MVFHTDWVWVSSLKKYVSYVLNIYGYHIYKYFQCSGLPTVSSPHWCETDCRGAHGGTYMTL